MALISLQDVSLAFDGPLLFDEMTLQLEKGERVALLGRNGVGKTTLMKVMSGEIKVDKGSVIYQKGMKITHLSQEVPSNITGSVFDIVLSGLGGRVKLLSDYHHVSHRLQTEYSEQLMKQLGDLQSEMDHSNGWETARQVEEVIAEMKLDSESNFEELSGGQKRRTLLGKALVMKPEILLLDEPTNHLDIEAIDWLETFLKAYPGTVIFVTHDRMFMQHLATKIVELDRGKLYSWSCDYQTFLERKELAIHAEASERERFEKKLAEEEIWVRQGIKARRTRNEGRVKALERMREAKRAQRQTIGKVRMKVQETDLSGERVIKVDHLNHHYGDLCLIRNFSTKIVRGDKIGVIGPNGSGKTTLLRLLLGKIPPQKGTVHLGTNLEISYYDQLRELLDEDKTVAQNVCETGDILTINGKSKHVLGYLQDFLFSPSRARTPVRVLSGGERNRLFLARLFTKPSNLLVMDEPTNDLDVETLELLEELLVVYSGTLLLVSHDRAFLNNVVTSTMVLEGDGVIGEYPGGYNDWLSQRQIAHPLEQMEGVEKIQAPKKERVRKPGSLSFKEKRELEGLPEKIEKLEADQAERINIMGDREFYKKDPKEIADIKLKLQETAENLLEAYKRWEFLDKLKSQ